jgi:hypothetical protein
MWGTYGYWLQPVKSSGVSTRLNAIEIRFGGTSVPIVRPIAAPTSAPRIRMTTNSAAPSARHGTEPRMRTPIGNMQTAAISARIAAKIIFSTATRAVGIGASSRSSISFVKLNSSTSGSAVDCSDVSSAVSATMPGKSRCA